MIIGLIAEKCAGKKIVQIICYSYSWLQLTVLAAIRWGIGYDYNQYYNTFYEVSQASGWAELLQRREEIGFLFFNRCMSYITDNVIVYLFFYYGLMYALLIWYVYKYSEVKWVSIMTFLAFDYFAVSICFMRQSMAMVIGLYAIEMMKKRKWYWTLLLVCIAALFHSSAFILLLGLGFSYIDFTKKKVQIVALVTALLLYVGCDFILWHVLVGPFEKYRGYLVSVFMMSNHIFAVFYPMIVFLFVVIYGKRLCAWDKEFKRLIPVLFMGSFLALLTTKHYIIERMSLYITLYNIRVVAMILALFIKNAQDKWDHHVAIVRAVIVCVGAFVLSLLNDRYGILPYEVNKRHLTGKFFQSEYSTDMEWQEQALGLEERKKYYEKNEIFISYSSSCSSGSSSGIC